MCQARGKSPPPSFIANPGAIERLRLEQWRSERKDSFSQELCMAQKNISTCVEGTERVANYSAGFG